MMKYFDGSSGLPSPTNLVSMSRGVPEYRVLVWAVKLLRVVVGVKHAAPREQSLNEREPG
jgi:hypothetical protein